MRSWTKHVFPTVSCLVASQIQLEEECIKNALCWMCGESHILGMLIIIYSLHISQVMFVYYNTFGNGRGIIGIPCVWLSTNIHLRALVCTMLPYFCYLLLIVNGLQINSSACMRSTSPVLYSGIVKERRQIWREQIPTELKEPLTVFAGLLQQQPS